MNSEDLKKILSTDGGEEYEFGDDTLRKTVEFVKKAHRGQYDKMGFPYYTHPYRVCQLVKDKFGSSPLHTQGQVNFACILALLHDVCEDTEYTPDMVVTELGLNAKQEDELKFCLGYITHDKENDPYSEYIRKIAEGPAIYPVWVKFCDLLDNSSLDRVIVSNDSYFLTGEDMNRINKYLISIRILRKRLECGYAGFKCDDSEVKMINSFRTASERMRFEKQKGGEQYKRE